MSNRMKYVKAVLQNPKIIFDFILRKNYKWSEDTATKFKKKEYKSYDEYLSHQKSKLDIVKYAWLPDYDVKYHSVLRERLKENGIVKKGMNVLCLAARMGTEVKSFLDLGCFAIGLDLNPGQNNKYVVCGDFHNIQFPDKSVDVIFSNSLDHAFNFDKLINEMKRVLKENGHLILEISKGLKEGYKPGYYEAVSWEKVDDLLKIFGKYGFKVIKRSDFEYPDPGQHVILAY